MKEKIIVFGGSGFLGSHVADILTESGYEVVIFDKRKSPYLRSGQKMVVADILDENKVMDVLKNAKFAYNFASIANINESSKRPLDTIRYNILGHSIILNSAVKRKVERIIFASSIYVYSHFGSFYRVAKQSCELLTEAFHEKYGLKYSILRYGSLYGPRSQPWNGIYRYLYQALSEGRINYHGTGDEVREYIHVVDAAKLSIKILGPEFENQSVILTGTQTLTSSQLLNTINEMLNKRIKIKFIRKRPDYHYSISPYVFSPRLAKKLVSNLFIDIGQGLLELAEEIYRDKHKELRNVKNWYVRRK